MIEIDPETKTFPFDETVVERITRQKPNLQAELLRWLAKQGSPVWGEVWERQQGYLQRFRDACRAGDAEKASDWREHRREVVHSCFLLVVYSLKNADIVLRRKAEKSQAEIEAEAEIFRINVAKVKADVRQRSAPRAAAYRQQHFRVVVRLRAEGLSWAECANYLQRFHNARYSAGWLYKTHAQIVAEMEAAGCPTR